MQDENILIDQLEDQLIDHPDASTTMQLSETSYDEIFQNKLNERANQIFSGPQGQNKDGQGANCHLFLLTKSVLHYKHRDLGELAQDLSDWFTSAELKLLDLDALQRKYKDKLPVLPSKHDELADDVLDDVLYLTLGSFASASSHEEQLACIAENCPRLVSKGTYVAVFEQLDTCLDQLGLTVSKGADLRLFKLMTIAYFLMSTQLASQVDPVLADHLSNTEFLPKLVQLVAEWKQNPSPGLRVRNVLLLFWKAVLVTFGGTDKAKRADEYLVKKHSIKNKARKSTLKKGLVCSPLDYFTFRENLSDKYPMMQNPDIPKPGLTEDEDAESIHSILLELNSVTDDPDTYMAVHSCTNSLSKLIEVPRTNKSHTVLGQLPMQTLHIATPVPSPPSTPSDFMSGGEKLRKLYHVHQGMPFIYPSETAQAVPEAITEAEALLEDALYESYSAKRLWKERQLFMKQERGNVDEYELEDPDEGFEEDVHNEEYEEYSAEIESLLRVEKFYASSMAQLRGLVEVMIGVMKSSKIEVNLRDVEKELDPATSFTRKFGATGHNVNTKVQEMIYLQLELIRVKETTLKACSATLSLLLKWFKTSHVLKYYYLSSLLFDSQFLNVFVEFLGSSFSNTALQNDDEDNRGLPAYEVLSAQNRLMNPAIRIPHFDFFNVCQGKKAPSKEKVRLINKTPLAKMPTTTEKDETIVNITEFNEGFCFILANLLNVANKILIKNIAQRVFVLNETKATDLLKVVLLNYVCDDLKLPILKIFKKLVPYQGRKWRSLNMDVISLIYMNLKLTLKDNWLSGRDLESDFNNSVDQEIALRSLLQFYNVRRYPNQMHSLGYTLDSSSTSPEYE